MACCKKPKSEFLDDENFFGYYISSRKVMIAQKQGL